MDTIGLCTKVFVNDMQLKNAGWSLYKNVNTNVLFYHINYNGINMRYYSINQMLCIQLSASKLLYGDNSILFNFADLSRLILEVNCSIKCSLKGLRVKCITEWNVTRLDIPLHYYVENRIDLTTYIETIWKLKMPYSKRELKYSTGKKSMNKSKNITCYAKFDEMLTRKSKYNNLNTDFDILVKPLKNILRIEFQLKKSWIYRNYKNNRKFKDLINPDLFKELCLKFIKEYKLDIPFLYKEDLLNQLKLNFSNTKHMNLSKFVMELNTNGLHSIGKLTSTYYNYFREARANDINLFFLNNKIKKHIDFTDITFKADTKSNNKLLRYKYILIILNLIFICLNCEFNSTIASICKIYPFKLYPIIPFFYDDGG